MNRDSPFVLRIAQVVPSTEAEGPGRRYALWVQGCPLRCPDCCNPGMLSFGEGRETAVDALAERILATDGIEGVSYLGGEPTAQAAPLARLSTALRRAGLSVMLYSGYTLAELQGQGRPEVDDLLSRTDLLVDGRYDRTLPERGPGARRWIGSRNQVLHFLSDRYHPGDPRFHAPNTVEVRLVNGEIVVNGWPPLARRLASR